MAGAGVEAYTYAQIDLSPVTPSAPGTWAHYGHHYSVIHWWFESDYLGGSEHHFHSTQAFAAVPAPSISWVSPTAGLVGQAVTIAGGQFGASQGGSTVTFNGTPAPVTSWSDTSLAVTVPGGATTGPIVVTVNDWASNGAPFTVLTEPSADGVAPSSGAGISQTFTLTFSSPAGAGDIADMRLWFVDPAGPPPSTAETCQIHYLAASHALGLYHDSGAGLTWAPVGGSTGLQNSQCVVAAGASSAIASGTQWTLTIPVTFQPGWVGLRHVYLIAVTAGGASTPGGWQYRGSWTIAPPSISDVNPSSGVVGQTVTLTGNHFGTTKGTSTVTFAGLSAPTSSWSDTSITATVPAGATAGPVVVTVGGHASNGVPFTPLGGPSLTSLSRTFGLAGTVVTVTGTHFGPTQSGHTIQFNGTPASVSAGASTSITATVPGGATSGPVVVTVGGQPSNGIAFTVATEEVQYYHTDAIGSVRMVTHATQAVLERYDYTPFGQPWLMSTRGERSGRKTPFIPSIVSW